MNAGTPVMLSGSAVILEGGRLIRFGIVGVCATFLYAGTSLVAIKAFLLSPVAASIIGHLAAMGISYCGHSAFSFRLAFDHRNYLWRFLTIAAAMIAINGMVTWVLTRQFGLDYWIPVA